MLVQFGVELVQPEWSGCVVCVGTFDGVHLGHQSLLERAVAIARSKTLPCVVVTFDRHPAHVLRPGNVPPSVGTLEQNVQAIRGFGPALCLILPFDRALAEQSAESFFQGVLVSRLKAEAIVIGHDFAFGHDRQGDANWLAQRIETDVVEPFVIEGERVSSSAVRSSIAAGDVKRSSTLLGRPFSLRGVVVKGQQLGRTIGYPTVNLARVSHQVVPADGIYAGTCTCPSGTYKAAISIGMRPAVNGQHRTVEAYLMNYPGDDLYGAPIEIAFCTRLREELDFPDLESLRLQIAADVALTDQTVQL